MRVPSVTITASIGVRYLARPSIAFSILGTFLVTGVRIIHRCSTMKTPAMTTGVSVPTAFRDAGKRIISVGDKSMRARDADTPRKLQQIPIN